VGPHNLAFKTLNSQLLREVAQYEAAANAAGRVLEDAAAEWDEDNGGWEGEEASAAPTRGVRLGGTSTPPLLAAAGGAGARVAAGLAAVQRFEVERQRQEEETAAAAAAAAAAVAAAEQAAAAAAAASGSEGGSSSDDLEEGHFDAETDAKERQMELLGSLDEGDGAMMVDVRAGDAERADGGGGGGDAMTVEQASAAAAVAAMAPLQLGSPHRRSSSPAAALASAAAPPAQPAAATSAAAAAPSPSSPAAVAVGDNDLFSALDSPSRRKLSQAREALQSLHLEVAAATAAAPAAAAATAACLDTLTKALVNLVNAPSETKYHVLKITTNPAVASRIGRWAAARRLLQLAGFEERAGEGGAAALVWTRRDPGLAWLVLSAVQQAAIS
jgi:hypothetical protein